MKSYTVKKLTDGDWSSIESVDIAEKYLDTPENVSATAKLAYDDEGLIVKLHTKEFEHRCVEKGPFGIPCEDCCLEFFFSPFEEDNRYFNIEFNSNACMYLGIGTCVEDLIRLVPEEENIFKPIIEKSENEWGIEYKIPTSFIKRFFSDFELYEGKKMRANFFKCADMTTPAHYLSWSKVDEKNFTFHQRENFGLLTVVK